MKNLASVIMLCFLLTPFTEVRAQFSDTTSYNFGIWQAWSPPLSSVLYPEIKGRLCNQKWKDIEPQPNVFNWTAFDSEMASRASDGLPIVFCIYTKEDAPDWLFENGVPKVMERDSSGLVTGYAPYYKDSLYKAYFKRMIDSVQQHVETMPFYVREKILAVQTAFGNTGDYISYKGIVDPQYQLNDSDFFDLFKEFTSYYYSAYSKSNPKIRLLNNPNKTGKDQIDWLIQNAPGGWLKAPAMAKGYGYNYDLDRMTWLYDYMNKPQQGDFFRSRSEISGPNTTAGWWVKDPYKNMFATLAYNIHWGLDWPNETPEIIQNPYHKPSLAFFNKYAGKKDPVKSDVAMCALKDALDASDSIRFPASEFGEVAPFNADRYRNIQQKFSGYGALLEDVTAAMATVDLGNLAATGYNDVGWRVLRGNYDRYLHQIDANETSVGFWNIPSSDMNTIYGKFGRSFELASNKDALYFNVDDLFLNNAPVNGQYPVTIDITYLDKGFGSWKLYYDALDETDKGSIEINCNNSGSWKKTTVTLNDVYFGNRGIRNSDFYIKSTGTEDVIFTLVELARSHQGIADFGMYALSAPSFDTICVNGSSLPKSFVVAGSYLNGTDVILHSSEGYEFSKDSDGVYTDSLVLKDYGAVFYQTIYVKFKPKEAKSYSGNFIISGGGMRDILVPVKAVAVNSTPRLQPIITPISCYGLRNGGIDLAISDGAGPFSFSWSNSSTFKSSSSAISNLAPDTYRVTIGSFAGCSFDTSFVIAEPPVLGAEISIDPMICKNGTTTLHVNGTGGTLPYEGIGIFNVSSGNQNYSITDANGCVKKGSINVPNGTLIAPAKPGTIASPLADKQGLCGGGEFEFSVSQVSTASSYTWSLPAKTEIIASNFDSTNITLKVFPDFTGGNISVTAANACGVSAAQTRMLNLVPGAPGQITGFTSVMPGQSGLVYSVEQLPGMSYEWTVPSSATIVSGQSTNMITVNWGITNGDVTVTAKNSCNAISTVSRQTIIVVSGAIALSATSLPEFETVCINGATNAQPLTVSAKDLDGSPVIVGPLPGFKFSKTERGTYSDTYSFTDYGRNINSRIIFVKYFPQTEGTVSAVIPVTGGGSLPAGVEVKAAAINSSPALSAQLASVSCIGDNNGKIDLTVSGGTGPFTYSWAGPGIYDSSAEDIEGLSASNYRVTVTSYLGCTTTETFTVPQPAPLSVTLSSDPMECKNGTTMVYVQAEGGTFPYTGTGAFSAGSGRSTYTVTDANGCVSSKTINVANGSGLAPLKPALITGAEADARGICGGGLFNFSIEPVANATGYTWTAADNSTIHSTSADGLSVQLLANSNFSTGNLSVTANNACGESPVQIKALTALPADPGMISGPSIVTAFQPGLTYSVPSVEGITFNWTLPNNGKIDEYRNSTIVSTWGRNTGRLKVTAGNNCGLSNFSYLDVSFATTATLYPSTTTVDFNEVCISAEKVSSFMLYGVLLNGSDVNIGPSENYSFSTTEDGEYSSTLTLQGYGNTINQPVFVKFKPVSANNFNRTLVISGGGISSVNLALRGNGVNSAPEIIETVQNALCYGAENGSVQLQLDGGSGPFTFSWYNGDNYLGSDQNISNLKAGDYMVKVGSQGGCFISKNISVSEPQQLEMNISTTLIDGMDKAIISANGGTMPYSGTGTFDLVEGQNVFVVSDANGCALSDSVFLEKDPPLFAIATTGTISCAGSTTEVVVTAEGGVAPYSGTGTFTVEAGTYSYTVEDANGQQAVVEITVEQPEPVEIKYSFDPIHCFGDSTTITITGSGGIAPYAGEGLFALAAGTTEFTITDSNGCVVSTTVEAAQPEQLFAHTEAGTILCNGDSTSVLVTATGGIAPYVGEGTYTIFAGNSTFKISDANGCTADAVVDVRQPVALTAKAEITDVDGIPMILVTATGGTYPYSGTGLFNPNPGENNFVISDSNNCSVAKSVFWQIGTGEQPMIVQAAAGVISCYGGTTTVNVTATGGLAPYTGTGRFEVRAGRHVFTISDAEANIDSIEVIISQPDSLSITATAGTILCYGGTTEVNISGTGGTAPYTGEGLFTLAAGNYEYQITDANGCATSASVAVLQPELLSVVATTNPVVCNGGNAEITILANGGTAPYTGEGLFTVMAGNYEYSVTDAAGCTAVTQVTVTQPDSLQILFNSNPILCNGGNTQLNVSGNGGTAPYTGEGVFAVGAGTYTYSITDANGCTATSSVNIAEPAVLTATSRLLDVGGQTKIEVAASGGTAPYSGTGIFIAVEGENTFNITDANGCSTTTSIVWENIQPLKASATAAGSITCYGGTTTVTITAEGGVAPYTGTGTFNAVAGTHQFIVTDANNNQAVAEIVIGQPGELTVSASFPAILCNDGKTTITVAATGGTAPYYGTGSYSVKAGIYNYTVKDKNGCSASTTATVTQPDKLKISKGPGNILCYGEKITVEVIATGGVAPYKGAGFFTLGAGTYTKTITDANGCTATATATIPQPELIVVSIDSKTDVSCQNGSDGSITASATGGKAPYTYSLDNVNYTKSSRFIGLKAGNYTVYAKDALGCVRFVKTTIANGTGNCLIGAGSETRLATRNYEVLTDWIELKAYPNPSYSDFAVSIKTVANDPVNLMVTDMYGNKVYQTKGSGHETYVFGKDLPSGLYILRIQQGDQVKTIKLIKGRG